jgi:hypothetical protein
MQTEYDSNSKVICHIIHLREKGKRLRERREVRNRFLLSSFHRYTDLKQRNRPDKFMLIKYM